MGSPAVTIFSVIDSRTYTFNVVATTDGNVRVSIDADVAQDIAGNGNTASNGFTLTIDRTAPSVSITNTPQSVNTESFTLTGTADADSTVEVFQNGGTIGTTTATTTRDWTLLVRLTDGANTFTATATDSTGNTSEATEAVIITLDTGRPGVTITSASGGNGATTNTRTLSYTAIFTEAVNGFDEGDITVTGTAILGSPSVTSFSVIDSRTYTFNVEATSDGNVIVSIGADLAQDLAGNGNTASSNHSLTIDRTAPTVIITTRTPQSVNTGSFTLTGTADAGSTVDVLKDGSTIGTTTATNGTWTLLVTLTDGVNTFTASSTNGAGNTGTSGEVIITLDTDRPGVAITSASGGNGATTNDRALSYTAIFDEAVNGFDEGDITVTGTASLGSPSVTIFSASADSRTYTFNVEATSDGNVIVSIDADVAQDIAGNGNTASNGFTLTIDRTAPSVSITNTPQSVNAGSFTLTGTAEAGSLVKVRQNGIPIGTETATGGTWTLLVTLTDGANTFTATATDNNGNTSDATDAVIITLDTDRPGVTITSTSGGDGGTANTRTLSYTAIFDEAVNGFDEGDITVTGTAISGSATATVISGFSATDSRTYTFNVEATTDGNVTVSIAAGVAQDSAGNGNTASNNHSLTIDSTAPTVSITTNTPQTVNTESFTLTGTADEAGSTVEVFQNGGSIGTTTATGGTWTLLVTLTDGANTFTATATDNNGNTSEATDAVIITLDTVRPGVTISSASGSNGATISDPHSELHSHL